MDGLTALIGLPGFVAALTAAILAWTSINILVGWAGLRPPDPPPFSWLQGALSMGALYLAALILTTQRQEDKLASPREQLILELAILNDEKTSKIIGLWEEARQSGPRRPRRRPRPRDIDAVRPSFCPARYQ